MYLPYIVSKQRCISDILEDLFVSSGALVRVKTTRMLLN